MRKQQEHQEQMRIQQDQQRLDMLAFQKALLEAAQKETKVEKKTKCPLWDKQEPLKRYLPRLKLWNNIQTHSGKYLDLLEALQLSERRKEKDKIELEVQKNNLDPEDRNIIDRIILKLEQWFGKTKIDEGSDAWRTFRDIKQKSNESVHEFVIRYETAEANVKANAGEISNDILVIQFLANVYF